MSAGEIGSRLGITHNAVRAHLADLLRSGFVREGGLRPGVSRPTVIYELVPRAESALSSAYIPFLAHLLKALGERMSDEDLADVMRAAGRSLSAEWPPLRGDLEQRVSGATALLDGLGAMNDVEKGDDGFVIRGHGCILAEAVHGRPEVCRAMESLLTELIGVNVEQCCERSERPRCCFRIHAGEKTFLAH